MSKILNSPFYSNKLHQTGKTVYSTPDHIYTIVDYNYSYEPTFSASLYHKTIDQIYPIRTKYLYSSVKLESFENIDATQKDSYPIKYELLYRSNDRYIKIEEAVSENGKASFTNLIKGYTYYIKAIDTSGKYQSKMVSYIPTEYDNTQEPQLLVSYKDLSYEKFQYYFITANVLGDKYVYLENNSDHIKLEKLDDKRYKISLTEVKNRADEFDLVYEEYRDENIIKKVERIYINDGFSTAYNISINFTENGSVIFKWKGDGKIDYYNVYLKGSTNSNDLPITSTGLNTYIANEYPLDKTRYLSIGSVRNDREKLPVDIVIPGVDPYLDKVELLIFANYGSPIKDTSSKNTSFTINGNTTIVNSNKFVDDGALYVDGNGDGIVIPINPLGESDFTFEYYFSLSSYTGTPRMFEFAESTGYNQLCGVFYNNTNMPYLAYKNNNVWTDYGKDIKTIPTNEYHHYCVMRKNNVIYYFIDGVLLTKITNTFPLLATHLYLGQSYVNSSYITGYYNSIRLTRGVGRYNIDGFALSDVSITALNKITKPDSLSYSIKSNNDLSITINHASNNVDNYSIYMSDAEITSIDTLPPIAKNTTNKSLVLPNFDVYNNYDKTLKLVATTNKYNHSYLSDNKDLYVAYDWTPNNITSSLWLDASDSSNIVDASGYVSQWKDKSGNECHFLQSNQSGMPILKNNGIYFNGSNRLLGNNNSLSISKAIDSLCIYVVAKIEGGQDYRTIINSSIDGVTSCRVGIYGRQSGIVESFGRRISGDSGQSVGVPISSKTSLIAGIFDYKNAKLYVGLDGNYTQKPGDFQTPGSTSNIDSYYFSIGHHPTNNTEGFIGFIHEIIICRYILSDMDKKKMEGYLAHKWNLTDNLPSDHPYKNNKPIIDHTPSFTYEILKDE